MSSLYLACHLALVPEELKFSAWEVTTSWHLHPHGLDSKVIFERRKCGTEIKKELSGKQTQTEQGYHFSGNKTDCVSMSKSIQAMKG